MRSDEVGAPKRIWRNTRFGRDGRPSSDLNGCLVHRNVCDVIRWPDGSEECMICARDRQMEASLPNAAFHMRPFWLWLPKAAAILEEPK